MRRVPLMPQGLIHPHKNSCPLIIEAPPRSIQPLPHLTNVSLNRPMQDQY